MSDEELARAIYVRLGLVGQEWAYLAILDEIRSANSRRIGD